jgi:hypothetical protein
MHSTTTHTHTHIYTHAHTHTHTHTHTAVHICGTWMTSKKSQDILKFFSDYGRL